jgi:DNA-binding response OmpR family regulator
MFVPMTRTVLIHATPRLAGLLAEPLEAQGFQPERVAAPAEIAGQALSVDAVILDAAHCDAAALAGELREQGFSGAIVLIDAEAPAADAVIARPIRFADLVAALNAPSRRSRVDAGLRLTEKEAAILERLEQARGAILPKAELLADVWGYGPNVATRTLETHIHRLRRKLDADPSYRQILTTEDGGYRLTRGR